MILDMLDRIELHAQALPHIAEALRCLDAHRDDAPGRYDFPGGFLMLQEGTTTALEDGSFEAHRRYLDVQVLLEGAETMEWADIALLSEVKPYDEDKDFVLYSGHGLRIDVKPGMFYVMMPHDAHKPCVHVTSPTRYRKAVIKLAL